MMQHFVLVVDHLNTEPSIELSSERSSCNRFDDDPESEKESVSESKSLLQCRICHDDDIDSSMEVPCSCSGSLKYAHRKCIQRWCNEKGNTKCEICLKQFEPSYTAPPPLFQYGGTPMNFRGNWEISRQVEDDSSVVRIRRVPSDNFAIPGPRAMVYYWSTALVLLILLVLRHTLPLIISGKAPFKLVGVVSDYDLLALDSISGSRETDTNMFPEVDSTWKTFNAIQKLLSKTNGKLISDVMSTVPIVVRETTNLEDAARLLLETKYRRLLVVDNLGKLVGIITRGNVVRAALEIKHENEKKTKV